MNWNHYVCLSIYLSALLSVRLSMETNISKGILLHFTRITFAGILYYHSMLFMCIILHLKNDKRFSTFTVYNIVTQFRLCLPQFNICNNAIVIPRHRQRDIVLVLSIVCLEPYLGSALADFIETWY